MDHSDPLLRRRDAAVPRGVPRVTGLTVTSGEGSLLRTADGRALIDLATGIGVMALGHGRAEVVEAIREQAGRLTHVCMHVATYEPYVALCERLAALVPHGEATRTMLVNSGAEAVENAVKIARQATGRPALLCYTDAFHGRTMVAMTLTAKVATKYGCGPYAPEVYRLPFPNPFAHGRRDDVDRFVDEQLVRLREAFVQVVAAEQLAAVIIEPVLGEGGIVPCPPRYLRGLRAICDEHGVLLICDEVQAGLGRTGHWASYEHAGIVPDLSTWAKALGGGLPLGAVVGRAAVMDAARPGTIGGTFGGNPVACAAALATLRVLEDEQLGARATELGALVEGRLRALAERCPLVADVRGLGLMFAIELCEAGDPARPASDRARAVVEGCLARGVLAIRAGAAGNVIRLLPPLTIATDLMERALGVLEQEVVRVAGA